MTLIKRAFRKAQRITKFHMRRGKARRLGVEFVYPNYVYRNIFNQSSVVIDVGCADDADFSVHILDRFDAQVFGVDPTRKHRGALKALEERSEGRFKHLALAVTSTEGGITFHESAENQSGSILNDHSNVMTDTITTYDVESVTLKSLIQRIDRTQVDFLKLDLEGAEYDLLNNITSEDLKPFRQIFVEFHHHNTSRTPDETKEIVQSIANFGFSVFSFDDHNYLFFR